MRRMLIGVGLLTALAGPERSTNRRDDLDGPRAATEQGVVADPVASL
jgi:hypothetical protein